MPQQVRAVVAREKGAPATVETIVVPDPGPGEAVVAWYGDCLPSRDFPLLIDYRQGRLGLDGFVSERIPPDGVEEAFGRMERGEVLRSVVVL